MQDFGVSFHIYLFGLKLCYQFGISPALATGSSHSILLPLIALRVLGEENNYGVFHIFLLPITAHAIWLSACSCG
jgi:hypothetical protein